MKVIYICSSIIFLLFAVSGCDVVIVSGPDLQIPEWLFRAKKFNPQNIGYDDDEYVGFGFSVDEEYYDTNLPVYLGADYYPNGTIGVESYLETGRNEYYSVDRFSKELGQPVKIYWGAYGGSPPPWLLPENWNDSLLGPLRKEEIVTAYRYVCNEGTEASPRTTTELGIEVSTRDGQIVDQQTITAQTPSIEAEDCIPLSFEIKYREFGDYDFIFYLDKEDKVNDTNTSNNVVQDEKRNNMGPIITPETRQAESWKCNDSLEYQVDKTVSLSDQGIEVVDFKVTTSRISCVSRARDRWVNELQLQNNTGKYLSFEYYIYWTRKGGWTGDKSRLGWGFRDETVRLAPFSTLDVGILNDYVLYGEANTGILNVIQIGEIEYE